MAYESTSANKAGRGKPHAGRPELRRHRSKERENPVKKIVDNIRSISQGNKDGRPKSWL